MAPKWTTLKAQSDNRNWLAGRAGRLFAAELRNLGNSKSNSTAVNGGFTSMTRGRPFAVAATVCNVNQIFRYETYKQATFLQS